MILKKPNIDLINNILKTIGDNKTKKIILAFNKIDKITKENLIQLVYKICKDKEFLSVFMICAINGSGCEDLKTFLLTLQGSDYFLFPEDQITIYRNRNMRLK